MAQPDVVIAGAGSIGMACALEFRRRGLRVTVLERGRAGQEASSAAAGMLAANDPANPAALHALSTYSLALYPAWLQMLEEQGSCTVPFETHWTLEEAPGHTADVAPLGMPGDGFERIAEQSLDPRKLAVALHHAVVAAGVDLQQGVAVEEFSSTPGGVEVRTTYGAISAAYLLDCTGAWSRTAVYPAKGQMLRVHALSALKAGTLGNVVVRNHRVYLVPRLDGSVVVGATVEDVGFDKTVYEADLLQLRTHAAALVPALADAPVVEQWAGLRPATPDALPLLGALPDHSGSAYVATGHFRNGVLLAPATAQVMAQLMLGEQTSVDLAAFAPERPALAAHLQRTTAAGAVFAQP